MIVVDASVLIGHLDRTDAHHDRATGLLVERAGDALGASPITLAEVLVGPARAGRITAAEQALGRLAVVGVPLPDDAPSRLAELRATTGLRLPDCCVLLAALAGATEVLTFDGRLAEAALALGFDVPA